MKDLKGKVAVVTGAAQGIGRETAILLAKSGCHLAVCDVDMDGLGETAEIIQGMGRRVSAHKVDTSDREAMHAFADAVAKAHGGVDIVVNNAGVALTCPIRDMEYEDFEWLMGINFWGMVHGTKAFLPHLEDRPEGHVVNISSVFGLWGIPTQSAYNCSKFAIRGFTEALGMELAGTNIHVTCVHPGGIRTNIAKNSRHTAKDDCAFGDKQQAMETFEKVARTTPEQAAKVIVKGIKKNRRRVLIGADAYVMDTIQRLFPVTYQRIIPAFEALSGRSSAKKGLVRRAG
ncbi:MAG: SDR family NAD(P)-dependent oxidoreductase [Desulfatibacillaceae bacterium]